MFSLNTPEETLKYFLFKVMSDEDATRFMSLKEVLAACEKQEPPWQAIYALSAHVHVLANYRTGSEFVDYVGKHTTGFDDFLRFAEALKGSNKSYRVDEDEKRAFHDYVERCITPTSALYHKVAKHELALEPWLFLSALCGGQNAALWRSVGISQEGPSDSDTYKETISDDIDPERYPFVGYAKLMAANTIVPMLLKQGDYASAVEAMTKVAECLPTEEVFLELEELASKWLNLCESIPLGTGESETQWIGLVERVPAVAEIAGAMLADAFDRCEKKGSLLEADRRSEVFWAWKFGYVVGRLAEVAAEMPFQDLTAHSEYWGYGWLAISLLASRDANIDYFAMWQRAMELPNTGQQDLTEVPPSDGLYWAMRAGFAEGMRGKAVTIVPQTGTVEKDILSSIGVRQVKHDLIMNEKFDELIQNQRVLMARSQPSLAEIENYLLETLDDTFDRLPLQVIDHLKQAEIDFTSGVRQSNARVEFVKSVEAALDCLFISPLRSYHKQYKLGWPFMAPSPDGSKNVYGIRQWGEHFCKLAQPMSQQLGNINQPGINRFLKECYPDLNYCELEILGKSLQDVQKLRGGSAHYQSQFPPNKEIQQLKDLRKMVLGLESRTSVIKQIVEIFGNKPPTLLPGSTG